MSFEFTFWFKDDGLNHELKTLHSSECWHMFHLSLRLVLGSWKSLSVDWLSKDLKSWVEFLGFSLLSTFLGNILGATLNAFTVEKFRSAEIWTVGCWVRSANASTVLGPPYPHRHLLLNVRVNIVNILALKNSKGKWKKWFYVVPTRAWKHLAKICTFGSRKD